MKRNRMVLSLPSNANSISCKQIWFQKGILFLIYSDLRGSATTDMQGVESLILWSSSEDKQSLLCGGSVLSSESTSSASNETKTKTKNLTTFKPMRKTQNLQVVTEKLPYQFAQVTQPSCTSRIQNNTAFSMSSAIPQFLLRQGTMTKGPLFKCHTIVLSTIWLSKYFNVKTRGGYLIHSQIFTECLLCAKWWEENNETPWLLRSSQCGGDNETNNFKTV